MSSSTNVVVKQQLQNSSITGHLQSVTVPPIMSNGDYENYRSWIMYNYPGISRTEVFSAKVEDYSAATDTNEDRKQPKDVVYFENIPSLDAYMLKEMKNCSLVYPTKSGDYKFIKAFDTNGNLIPDLLTYMGFTLKELKQANPNKQKLIKRIKRLFRNTKYGFTDNNMNFIIHPDEEKKFDGLAILSMQWLKDHGITAKLWDRFSMTVVDKTIGTWKGHCICANIRADMIMFGKPVKELGYTGENNFIQLDPVHIKETVRADIQSLASMWAAGFVDQKRIADIMVGGLGMISKKVMDPIKANDCVGIDTKIVKLGLHEVSIMLPGFVRMKWNSEKEGLLKFNKLKFPIPEAIKTYSSPLFNVSYDGEVTLLCGDKLIVENGNLFIPHNMIDKFNQTHGGADFDDGFSLMPGKDGKWITWRSPNTMKEIASYEVEVRS